MSVCLSGAMALIPCRSNDEAAVRGDSDGVHKVMCSVELSGHCIAIHNNNDGRASEMWMRC